MSDLRLSLTELNYLLSPQAVRERAKTVFTFTQGGHGSFIFRPENFKSTVAYVMDVIHKNYPSGKIPFHSRWGHFRAGGIDRAAALKQRLSNVEPLERARVELDLVITSVLLDAGAGASWQYIEKSSDKVFKRSEGLGVASFHMFLSGVMSGDGTALKAESRGLQRVTAEDLRRHFQVTAENPLLGVDGRVALLNGLSRALSNKMIFKDGRPGNIIDYLMERHGRSIPASALLRAVLDGFGPIWPGRLSSNGVNLGDVWRHSRLGEGFQGLVPLHKLSQWMTYSLIEPIQDAGLEVTGIEELTGLAEYRNGGLLLDSEVLLLKNPEDAGKAWAPGSDLIIEWRALTVHLLDLIGVEVQKALRKTPQEFPLAKVLEGGTWWAGRFLAKEKRASGDPPLRIESDGTVF
ncbi:MAG: DUF1688 family protein [Bdellovibrionales bacterium]|nr:DUF1688 family protein [Bdellovibrionales bacterium]